GAGGYPARDLRHRARRPLPRRPPHRRGRGGARPRRQGHGAHAPGGAQDPARGGRPPPRRGRPVPFRGEERGLPLAPQHSPGLRRRRERRRGLHGDGVRPRGHPGGRNTRPRAALTSPRRRVRLGGLGRPLRGAQEKHRSQGHKAPEHSRGRARPRPRGGLRNRGVLGRPGLRGGHRGPLSDRRGHGRLPLPGAGKRPAPEPAQRPLLHGRGPLRDARRSSPVRPPGRRRAGGRADAPVGIPRPSGPVRAVDLSRARRPGSAPALEGPRQPLPLGPGAHPRARPQPGRRSPLARVPDRPASGSAAIPFPAPPVPRSLGDPSAPDGAGRRARRRPAPRSRLGPRRGDRPKPLHRGRRLLRTRRRGRRRPVRGPPQPAHRSRVRNSVARVRRRDHRAGRPVRGRPARPAPRRFARRAARRPADPLRRRPSPRIPGRNAAASPGRRPGRRGRRPFPTARSGAKAFPQTDLRRRPYLDRPL
ncbi:MAG: Serine/threonine protein kinase PrkC, regulator of stationary phase, partial [uncultured Rubrobacteraceae bacterium]